MTDLFDAMVNGWWYPVGVVLAVGGRCGYVWWKGRRSATLGALLGSWVLLLVPRVGQQLTGGRAHMGLPMWATLGLLVLGLPVAFVLVGVVGGGKSDPMVNEPALRHRLLTAVFRHRPEVWGRGGGA
ncbi:hypothetical protein ACIQU6_30620 [Streptomyces sp. NPDC090442]|uniref:hypothetical protein n=1 Tax=Streptomyces sp. NPDC090442 TaxID=3365962 RepID=UPI0038295F58